MKEKLTELCKGWGADLVGFAPIDRFPADSAVRRLLPETKTVIGLGFRVLRGAYRGIEEGSTYYQYTTMGVENMEETVMPMVQVRLSMYLEEQGYLALPYHLLAHYADGARSAASQADFWSSLAVVRRGQDE